MILWTIQTETAWKQLNTDRYLRGHKKFIFEPFFLPAYQWMMQQMARRTGTAPDKTSLPVWAWYQWENEKRKRPDLRAAGHVSKGETAVQIEFHCDEKDVLLSDFELWHYVLNYWYLPISLEDRDRFELQTGNEPSHDSLHQSRYHDKIVQSWDKIFDLNWIEPDIVWPRPQKSIQTVIWELKIEQVQDFTIFKGR